jgi:hypothetical protein
VDAFVEKHIVFYCKDIFGLKQVNPQFRTAFMDWLREHPQIDISKDQEKHGKPYVFTPFYWENGAKIMGTVTGKRNKDVIRGAAYRPKGFNHSKYEEEYVTA